MNYLKKILKEYNLNKSTNKYGTDKGDYKSYVERYNIFEKCEIMWTKFHKNEKRSC